MRTISLIAVALFLVTMTACSKDSAKDVEPREQPAATQAKSAEEAEMTVERYCKYYNEANPLLMEKYWPKLKGKTYAEAKDDYIAYEKEGKALLATHGVTDNDLSSFFRSHFKDVDEYRAKDPAYKKYPEQQEAKMLLAKFAMEGMGE
jgi:hypothetical protein